MEARSHNRRPGAVFPGGVIGGGAAAALLALSLFGCAVAPAPPIAKTPSVVASPLPGRVTVGADRAEAVAGVVPVYVSVANGSDVSRAILPSQVFAVTESGQRVAPLPATEAARRAGGALHLKSTLANAAASGVAAGAIGGGVGAAAGSLAGGGISEGAIVGSALAAAGGILGGIARTQADAQSQSREQIDALALRPGDVRRNFTASGYVFFPEGDYRELDVILVNRETGDTEEIRKPWP